ncbi:MAG: glycosyltransferase [Microcoleus sp.]
MSIYNNQQYLAQAIDSLLAQTFYDFELIIVDDAST